MRGLGLAERVSALKDVYGAGDPYMEVEKVRGGFRLIERNCPFLNIAMQRPAALQRDRLDRSLACLACASCARSDSSTATAAVFFA